MNSTDKLYPLAIQWLRTGKILVLPGTPKGMNYETQLIKQLLRHSRNTILLLSFPNVSISVYNQRFSLNLPQTTKKTRSIATFITINKRSTS